MAVKLSCSVPDGVWTLAKIVAKRKHQSTGTSAIVQHALRQYIVDNKDVLRDFDSVDDIIEALFSDIESGIRS